MKLVPIGFILVAIVIHGAHFATAQQEITMEAESDQGSFLVSVVWEPNKIGSDNYFSITFIEPVTGTVLEDIKYDFRVLKGDDGDQVLRRVDQVSGGQQVSFEETGPHSIVIEDIEGLGENASFTFEVTPEFPAILGVVTAIAVAVSVTVMRLTGINLFKFRD